MVLKNYFEVSYHEIDLFRMIVLFRNIYINDSECWFFYLLILLQV